MTKKGQPREPGFTQERFDEICKRIALGASLRQVCEEEGMPDRKTFAGWRQRSEALQAQYDRACIDREEVYFEQIIDIADGTGDPTQTRVQIDARKWVLARMNRKKYGDSITHSGDPEAPVQLVLNGSDIHG